MYENQIDILKTPNTAKSANSDAGDTFMRNCFANYENNLQHTLEINENLKKKIENEINDFRKIIFEEMLKKDSTSTVQFWRKHSIKFPHMSKPAL